MKQKIYTRKLFYLMSIIIIASLSVVIFLLFQPSSLAYRVSNNFMQQLLAGTAKDIAINDNVTNINLSTATQRNYKYIGSANSKDSYYYLYRFTDGKSPKFIRTGVKDSQLSHVQTGDSLRVLPSEHEGASKIAPNTAHQQCLSEYDLTLLDSTRLYAKSIRGATMIFLADTSEFQTDHGGKLLLERISKFYNSTRSKDYVIELKGYAPINKKMPLETTSRDDLFQERAVKIQAQLSSSGVPLDRIKISSSYNEFESDSTILNNEDYVDINIINRCSDK